MSDDGGVIGGRTPLTRDTPASGDVPRQVPSARAPRPVPAFPRALTGGLLIAGTTSDAGKSLVTAGLCRWLARQGHRVAPFKAQNMSNNSMVCADGSEIGRAQWLQAVAAGVEPEAAMNPVLLKPGSDQRSHVVLMGQPFGVLDSADWMTDRGVLADTAFQAYDDLRSRYDIVIAEGAGSPTEINLRDHDYINMGLARAAGLPVLVVGDIDRGGVFAAMFGTLALLAREDQALVSGWVINKFRGDVALLDPALSRLSELTGRPVLGTLPWLEDVWIDAEDALAVAGWSTPRPSASEVLQVAVVRLPRASNATDVDALAAEPGVVVTVTADPDIVAAAHLAILPGSRATVDDLDWLRDRGIADALEARHRAGRPILGICGGYQMLASSIDDPVESGRGRVPGLGLLPTLVRFEPAKELGTRSDSWEGHTVDSYQVHHGRTILDLVNPAVGQADPFLDGYRLESTWGTMHHGIFENDGFRRAWLTGVAGQAGTRWKATSDAPSFATRRESMLDRLADALERHVDMDTVLAIIEHGPPKGLPFTPPGVPAPAGGPTANDGRTSHPPAAPDRPAVTDRAAADQPPSPGDRPPRPDPVRTRYPDLVRVRSSNRRDADPQVPVVERRRHLAVPKHDAGPWAPDQRRSGGHRTGSEPAPVVDRDLVEPVLARIEPAPGNRLQRAAATAARRRSGLAEEAVDHPSDAAERQLR